MLSGAASRTVGYYVAGPIVALIFGPIIYGGFWKGKNYTDTYIKSLDRINITLQYDNPRQGFKPKEDNFHIEYYTDNNSDYSLHSYTYYIKVYKKYFELICFEGLEMYEATDGKTYDLGKMRNRETRGDPVLPIENRKPMTISVYVNRLQWKDPSYGTKAKPVPVFMNRLVSGDVMDIENAEAFEYNRRLRPMDVTFVEKIFLPPDVVSILRNDIPHDNLRLYVKQYLGHILSKEEFKRVFDK